ncbi:MAG: LemA family protein [Bacteroidetes bacterium]|nr:LemA family protein [Bacteroidota bacterium]MBS1756402.1 LemA family protein [Bacteroidota bacterium]
MNNKRFSGYIIGACIILLGIYTIVTYNALVKKEEKVNLQWNEVQNAYQRRLDLVPSLVNTVKGAAQYEQNTLEKIATARAKASNASASTDVTAENYQSQTTAQDELAGAANQLLISVENYPELKGTKAFIGLQAQLEGTERRIKVARKDFNASVAVYNSSVKSFPTKIIAGLFNFKAKEGFQSDSGTDKAQEIKF